MTELEEQAKVAGWDPAFPGQRPPFQPGHMVSVKGGQWSPRVNSERALQVFKEYARDRPDMASTYPSELAALARVEARAVQLDEWLETHPITEVGKDNRVHVVKEWRLCEASASAMRTKLGFNLAGDAQARRDVAVAAVAEVDLGRTAEAGRRRVIEHDERLALPDAASEGSSL